MIRRGTYVELDVCKEVVSGMLPVHAPSARVQFASLTTQLLP